MGLLIPWIQTTLEARRNSAILLLFCIHLLQWQRVFFIPKIVLELSSVSIAATSRFLCWFPHKHYKLCLPKHFCNNRTLGALVQRAYPSICLQDAQLSMQRTKRIKACCGQTGWGATDLMRVGSPPTFILLHRESCQQRKRLSLKRVLVLHVKWSLSSVIADWHCPLDSLVFKIFSIVTVTEWRVSSGVDTAWDTPSGTECNEVLLSVCWLFS